MRKNYTLKVNETDERLESLSAAPFLYEKTFENIRADSPESFIENNPSMVDVMETVPNGIAVISPDLRVVYMNRKMREWFSAGRRNYHIKCYHLFHRGQKGPCRECPARTSLETKMAASVFHNSLPEGEGGGVMYTHVHTFPILNRREEVVAFVEYAYNLNEQNDLVEQVGELKGRLALLEQENALLRRELEENRESAQELRTVVEDNLKNYVKPALEYLGTRVSREERRIFTSLIEESVFPITKTRTARGLNLSSRELQIAMMIREGQSSKQIADTLYITKKAVDYHRANIRKKLGVDAKTNLQSYLRAYL